MKPSNFFVGVLGVSLFSVAGCGGAPVRSSGDSGPHFTETVNAQTFFKGNIHTHSNASDGDAPPERVLSWYKKHNYNFVALTDHDRLIIDTRYDGPEFITLPGVELTGEATEAGKTKIPVHVNAICARSELKGVRASKSVADTANAMIKASHDDGAVTLLNHPNYEWAISPDNLLKIDGFELLEIASGHALIHDAGDESHASEEELWDAYLSQKHRVFASGADDAHGYLKFGDSEPANPGRVWVQVWAAALDKQNICDALRVGHFYVARGSKLSAVVVTPKTLDVQVDGWQPSTDHVDFIGAGGRLLDKTFEMPARYTLKGGEGYVRAHVYQGGHREAWTQAYFIKE